MSIRTVLICSLVLFGCDDGSSSNDPQTDGGQQATDHHRDASQADAAGGDAGAAQGEFPGCAAMQLASEPDATFEFGQRIQPGEEKEVCELRQNGPDDLWINWTEMQLSPGSHHGLLWETNYEDLPETDLQGDPIELGKVVPCEEGANGRFEVRRPFAGSQGRSNLTEKGSLPSDGAVKLRANAYYVLDLHMLNSTNKPVDACLKVGAHLIDGDKVKKEAGVMFFYDPFIAVPAGGASQARMACPITHDIFLSNAVSHMHKHGVGYAAKWLDGDPYNAGTEMVKTLYETTNWDDPEVSPFDEPLAIKQGDFIDYSCDYKNTTDHNVAQGLDTTDEMCMFMGVYWPYDDSQTYCALPGSGIQRSGSNGYQIGSGDLDGEGFINCVLSADYSGGATELCGSTGCKNYEARYKWQSCFTRACSGIGKYTRPYMDCLFDNTDQCQESCTDDMGKQDISCVLDCVQSDACKDETDTLMAQSCD